MGASYSLLSRYNYDVFVSFRNKDTGKNFTDHLYEALTESRKRIIRDDDKLQREENIGLESHENAIQESRIPVIVFSKDYASSRRCLEELVLIMELKRTSGHIALPVFYDVDPSQVRHQTESYHEAFAEHEIMFMEEMEKVEKWRAALKEVANLGGMVLQDRYETQFIYSKYCGRD